MKNFEHEKKIMILGAAYSQMPFYEAAKRMKIDTVAVSIEGEYPGFDIADEISYTDIKDKEAVYKLAKDFKADGVVTCANDWGIESLGYACKKLGFKGPSLKATECSNNKYKMKLAFEETNVCTPKWAKVSSPEELRRVINKISFPVIVKAVDLMGGRGVFFCKNTEETFTAFHEALEQSKEKYCLVEEYIGGTDIGIEGMIQNGQIIALLPNNTKTKGKDIKIPIGHSIPLVNEEKYKNEILNQVNQIIRATELDNCAFNIDCILKDGKVYVDEMTARAGANGLCELMSLHYGINYYETIILLALGEGASSLFSKPNNRNYSAGLSESEIKADRLLPIIKTPIQELKIIKNNNNRFFIKREDYIPFSYGGSKVRIADYVLKDLKEKRKDALVIYGGYQSNLCRILSKACKENKIRCSMIVNEDDGEINYNTLNAKKILENNVKEYVCHKNNIAEVVTKAMNNFVSEGMHPYYIYGDCFGKGNETVLMKAGIDLYEEIAVQEKDLNLSFDYIFLASSTNMTQSGLQAGKIRNDGKEKIIGISVNRLKKRAQDEIIHNLNIAGIEAIEENVVYDESLLGGYGQYNQELYEFCKDIYDSEGIEMDPVYVGKGFYGMLKYLKENNIIDKSILFIHTGGRPIFIESIKND